MIHEDDIFAVFKWDFIQACCFEFWWFDWNRLLDQRQKRFLSEFFCVALTQLRITDRMLGSERLFELRNSCILLGTFPSVSKHWCFASQYRKSYRCTMRLIKFSILEDDFSKFVICSLISKSLSLFSFRWGAASFSSISESCSSGVFSASFVVDLVLRRVFTPDSH